MFNIFITRKLKIVIFSAEIFHGDLIFMMFGLAKWKSVSSEKESIFL